MPIIADITATEGPTFGELVTEIVATAQGYAIAPDRLLTLASDLTPTSTSMVVTGAASPGVYEVADELILVTAVEESSGTCTIHPRGRGWLGSVAADHEVGDIVAEGPAYPRIRAATAVNDVIAAMYPTVFGVAETQATTDGGLVEVPSDAQFILDVRVLDSNDEWQRVRFWEAEVNSSSVLTGRVVRTPKLCDGETVQVIYATRPERFSGADQQWSDTALPLGLKDVVVTGVLARFARTLDLGRLTDRFITPRGDNQQPQLGAGFAMARQLQADYQAGLEREAAALRKLYPARAHFVR